jgi:hypothetical protein
METTSQVSAGGVSQKLQGRHKFEGVSVSDIDICDLRSVLRWGASPADTVEIRREIGRRRSAYGQHRAKFARRRKHDLGWP